MWASNLEWYVKLIMYLFGMIAAFASLWCIDFNKIIRVGKKQYAVIVYIVFSLALGFLIGSLFIELGSIIRDQIN